MNGPAEPRTLKPLAWDFRVGGPGDRTAPWTRAELAVATGITEAYLTPHLEHLARAGFLLKGKVGSRAVYSRGEVERRRRPDLPEGWYWDVQLCFPRGVRTELIVVATDGWSPEGTGPIVVHPNDLDAPTTLARGLGSARYLAIESSLNLTARTAEWRASVEKTQARAIALGFVAGGTADDPTFEVTIASPADLLLKFSKLCSDLAFEAYRARRSRW